MAIVDRNVVDLDPINLSSNENRIHLLNFWRIRPRIYPIFTAFLVARKIALFRVPGQVFVPGRGLETRH